MRRPAREHIVAALRDISEAKQDRHERPLSSPQGAVVEVAGSRVINLCGNNYLGLANDPRIIRAAKEAIDAWGAGVAAGRPVSGTQEIHQRLERTVSEFLLTDDALLYGSGYDANCGVFEAILGAEDAVVSDELNHASIIDGIRLSKARRYRYRSRDVRDLEVQLERASGARICLVVTDGVFSMEGHVAPLEQICDLAATAGALVMVDDSHAVGVLGAHGRGTPELYGLEGCVDIVTGTFGKALGGGIGGYVAGRAEIVELLRQRSRPYLFSNALPPAIVGAATAAIEIVRSSSAARERLRENTSFFRSRLEELGLIVLPGDHPIVPVMLGDAGTATSIADRLLKLGVLATAFTYPVVPMGTARIRAQVSASHTTTDLQSAASALALAHETVGAGQLALPAEPG